MSGAEESKITAILIADEFEGCFQKHFESLDFCMIPVVNVPMIEYALQCLYRSAADEIYLCCKESSSEKIREHIASTWCRRLRIHLLHESNWQCTGDVLRSIYDKAVIRSDFILLHVNAINNLKLNEHLVRHRQLHKKDSNLAMTILLSDNYCAPKMQLFATNQNNKVVHYQPNANKISLPREIFLRDSKVVIQANFANGIGVMMCSQTVLSLFFDNFDFRSWDDFIITLLENEEVSQGNIYVENVDCKYYLGIVDDLNSYRKISIDIMKRDLYPLTPDSNSWSHLVNKTQHFFMNIYKSSSCQIDPTCVLKENVFVGINTNIGKGSAISNSVIGANCKIGTGCQIENSIIFSDNAIKNNVIVIDSVIVSSKECFKISHRESEEGVAADEEAAASAAAAAAASDEDILNAFYYLKIKKSKDEADFGLKADEIDDLKIFQTEIIDSLLRGFNSKLSCENLLVEINSSRYAYNISLSEVNSSVVTAILQLVTHEHIQMNSNSKFVKRIDAVLSYFDLIIGNYIKSDQSQIDCLEGIYEYYELSKNDLYMSKILSMFYEKDFISEEVLVDWVQKTSSNLSGCFLDSIKPFLRWLQEAEEEQSDD